MNLRLLTPADLASPYGKDSGPLAPADYLAASSAQLVVSASSFEDEYSTHKRVAQGFVKSQFAVRALPRRARQGIPVSASHFMDAVICVAKSGEVVSRDTATWKTIEKWFAETDQFRDCVEVGPIFVEKGASTGFEIDAFGNVNPDDYKKNVIRNALWNPRDALGQGVENLVFYCQLSNGTSALAIARQTTTTIPKTRIGLGDIAELMTQSSRKQRGVGCQRAIMLAHRQAGYFGNDTPAGNSMHQGEMLLPTIFAILTR
jgi:hypothetical protein